MGFDKARAAFGRLPLAVTVLETVRACCAHAALVRRRDDGLSWLYGDGTPLQVVYEQVSDEEHPLWGVYTALSDARTEMVLLAPCDTPLLGALTLRRLIEAAPAVASDGERIHPLVAVLPRTMAQAAHTLARAGAPAHQLVRDVRPVLVPADELRDHNHPQNLGAGPIARLLERIGVTDDALRERIARGERARLRAWGIVHPEDTA